MKPLLDLIKYGQSYWLDNLTRTMINNGALKKRVEEQGLRGVTSNPAIFHKAISGSADYDAQITQLARAGHSTQDIYERLAVTDVQHACDILQPVYNASDGVDGYVSLEVSPHLAHDTAGTMQEARRLFQDVDRPNVMIKIPGTPAGLPAIEEMLYEGLNINITLLFAIQNYEAVAQAYLRALERRVAKGAAVHTIASVASFFISRIDVLVDQLLAQRAAASASQSSVPAPAGLMGKVAVANAKLAYQSFKRLFSGPRWQALEAKGARVQRPLWASTSTKNPQYSDVVYVEPLIGPHTVNTMPDETIEAFAHHGVVVENSVEAHLDEARQVLRDLAAVGVDLDAATQQLQEEGVQKFIDPFDALLQALAAKQQTILAG
jgi:transaldolase